jgi:hypothetical protein
VYRIFSAKKKIFKCEENLWVSDLEAESHYQSKHEKNNGDYTSILSQLRINLRLGAELAGKIIADFTPLVRSGKIRLTNPDEGYEGAPHYKIEFELVMIINGRNLRFEARWGGEVQCSTQICIAAAFKPGTD